jgi:hypothetical protein
LQSFRNQWPIVLLLLALSILPLVQANQAVNVNFTVAQNAGTVYVAAWAQGELPPAVVFNVSIWYGARNTHGFVNIFSGTLLVQSTDGNASTLVQTTILGGGTDQTSHFFVWVGVYDAATGNLLGFAGYDPKAGGGNGGPG